MRRCSKAHSTYLKLNLETKKCRDVNWASLAFLPLLQSNFPPILNKNDDLSLDIFIAVSLSRDEKFLKVRSCKAA